MLSTKRHLSLGILAGLTSLGTSIAAFAGGAAPQSTVILNTATTLAYHAPNMPATQTTYKRRDGAGVMDTTIAFDRSTGDIFSFWTNSVPWGGNTGLNTGMQAAMAFTKITPTGLGPVTVKMLPNQGPQQTDAQRVFMRPNALLGKDFVAVVFADEEDGPQADGNPQAVIWVYDRQGNQLNVTNAGDVGQGPHDPVNLITLSGQQDGQQQCPHSYCQLPDEADGSQSWIMGVQRNNQNARLMKVNIKSDGAGGVAVTVPYLTTIVQNAQHDRVMLACPTDTGIAHGGQIVATSVEADGQPADYGVDAVLFDTVKGKTISKTRVYDSDPKNGLYAVQPTTQYINDSVVAFQFQVSNAVRNHNNGTVNTIGDQCNPNNGHCAAPQEAHLVTMSIPTAAGSPFTTIESITRDAPYQRHSEAFGMQYGPATSAGAAVGVIAGASDGMGAGLLQVIPIDATGHIGALDPMKVYQVSQYSDVAQLPAMTKRDPGQARGFIHGLYGVMNPSYQVNSGFMPTVKSFNISAVAGYADPTTDNRESLTFALVPATWDPAVATTPGSATSNVPPGPNGTPVAAPGTPVTNPGPGISSGTNAGSQGGSGTVGSGGIKTGYGGLGTDASAGCGCTTAGSDQTSGLAGIALMGLGFVFLGMRRNRNSKES